MPQPETLLQYLVRRVGFIRAGKILAFVTCWVAAEAELGLATVQPASTSAEIRDQARELVTEGPAERLGIEAYAKFWGQSRSSAYKEQARFREAFADRGFQTPRDLLEALDVDEADAAGLALVTFS